MKRTNRLMWLGLLAGGCLWGQALTTIRIGASSPGPVFLVDGTPYSSTQVFEWPVGSKHIVQFPFSLNADGVALPYQSPSGDTVRYAFQGWTENSGLLSQLGNSVQTISAAPALTSLVANVSTTYRVHIIFFGGSTNNRTTCGGTPDTPTGTGLRYGIIYFDGNCIADTTDIWTTTGVHILNAFPYPGWVFYGFNINSGPSQYLTTVNVTGTMNITPLFSIAKRVNFITNPIGFKVLVDGAAVNTPPSDSLASDGISCGADYTRLPPGAPPGFTPLCWGQFDFVPGSNHRVGAPVPQQDQAGNYWVFSGFSNGLKQNEVYTANSNTAVAETMVANFVPGVRVALLTNPAGLKLEVDGRSNWPSNNFIWGQGETHRVTAPAQSPDTHNRRWQFMNWSNQGSAAQDITVPTTTTNLALTASYQILGQVKVQSLPPGLSFTLDGASCVTPCVVDRADGSQMRVGIPATLATGPGSRYDFTSWLDGDSAASRQVTFNQDVQTLTAVYRGSYQLSTASDPAGGVTFRIDTPSADGFYPDGTQITVTAVPKDGYKFRRWAGDLSGTYPSGTLLMSGPHNVVAMLERVPFIAPAGVQNAAGPTPDGTVAPGSIISIFGDSLAQSLQVGPTNPLAQTLADVTVTVGDRVLPLFFVSPQQINAQVPSDLPAGQYTIQIHALGQPDVIGTFTVSRDAPGIFTQQNDRNLPLALAFHEDGTVVTLDNPARRNETVSIYGTGFGPYNGRVIDGFPVPPTDSFSVVDPVRVTVGSLDLQPEWTGAAKNMTGTTIVKLKIVDEMPSASSLDLSVLVNGKSSSKVVLPVQ